MEYIDLTPTWEEILPTWLAIYRAAINGQCDDPLTVINNAEKEFKRMAQAADRWNARKIELPLGGDFIDREALERWRQLASSGNGHDMSRANNNTMIRLINTIDALCKESAR